MNESDRLEARDVVSFGPFRLFRAERLIEKDGLPFQLGGRALDLLIALTERAGEVVNKSDLIARGWPDVIVEESSLRVHIASLRKALGDGLDGARYVANVPGRGYCLVARITTSQISGARPDEYGLVSERGHGLPTGLMRMIGRDETVRAISQQLEGQRFVTVVGPGGMGKTTVAVAVGHASMPSFEGGVYFVDLGCLTDPAHVASTVMSTLGLSVQTAEMVTSVVGFLRDKHVLLVLDSCEHVIDSVAVLAEQIFQRTQRVHLLVTSREPLRVEGEHVYQLSPLDSAPAYGCITASEALAFPATQLFVERATACESRFALSDADAPLVAELCRRLDGIPLAIELAAGRVNAYGIRGTAAHLDNRFRLLWQGRRTALPRHQTLNAMLDWSFNLLPERERIVLRRLSIFVGYFTLDAARSVVSSEDLNADLVTQAVGSLVAKSLASLQMVGSAVGYRLLDTTRAYALNKLVESDETNMVARRHAVYFSQLLGRSMVNAPALSDTGSLMWGMEHIGNVRAALEWSLWSQRDTAIGVELAAVAAPMFLGLSLLGECYNCSKTAIAVLANDDQETHLEMALQEALAIAAMFTKGNSEEVRAAIQRGLELAEKFSEERRQLRLLAGLNVFLTRTGNFRSALEIAQKSRAVARKIGSAEAVIVSDWMLGVAHQLVGNQVDAQRHCEVGLANGSGRYNTLIFGYSHRVRAMVALARALWLRGYAERAVATAWQAIEEAAGLGHPVTICISLIYATSVFLWTGNWSVAGDLISRLADHSDRHSLGPYSAVAIGLKGELLVRRGDPGAGIDLLQGCLEILNADRHQILSSALTSALAEGLAALGKLNEAIERIDEVIKLAENDQDGFDEPEVLRIRANLLASMPRPDLAQAERNLQQSWAYARRQSALGWELRTATTLAHVWANQGRRDEARTALGRVYSRFTEGFDTSDLKTARALLDDLG